MTQPIQSMANVKRYLFGESRSYDYEAGIYVFLSLFRFLGFALATAFIITIPRQLVVEWRTVVIISLLGFYTLYKVLFRFRRSPRNFLTYAILAFDLVICLVVISLTGGAESPFLLYSLLPVTTTALFFQRGLALAVATITASNLVLVHTSLTHFTRFPSILEGNYLTLVLLYTMFCFLLATVSYHSNLNIYRHIQYKAMVEERRRLRREIHDGIAQVMGYLNTKTKLTLKSPTASNEELRASLAEINEITSESYHDVREALDSLYTDDMAVSLTVALSSHIEEVQKRMNCRIEFVVSEKLPTLFKTTELQLLRIVQEALTNVRKHASATQVWVRLQSTPQGLELVVKDDGVGFSPPERKGVGLTIMAERAKSIGGILTITSSSGQGTEVHIFVPKGMIS